MSTLGSPVPTTVTAIVGLSCSSVCAKQVATSNICSSKTRMANDAAKKRETQRMRGRRELIYRPNTLVELHYAVLVMESCTTGVVRGQLSRILSSQEFAHNARLSSFLKFVVEQELSGCGDQLKESIIGVEVFGRRPDYDVRQDSVV